MTYSNEMLGGDDGLFKYAIITSLLCLLEKGGVIND